MRSILLSTRLDAVLTLILFNIFLGCINVAVAETSGSEQTAISTAGSAFPSAIAPLNASQPASNQTDDNGDELAKFGDTINVLGAVCNQLECQAGGFTGLLATDGKDRPRFC